MNTKSLFSAAFGYLLFGIFLYPAATRTVQGEVKKQWTVIPMDPKTKQTVYISDFALGKEGVPWAMLSTPPDTICYFKDGQWHKLAGNFRAGMYLCQLYTSPIGKVYMSQSQIEIRQNQQSNPKDNFGGLYLLENGKATYVTEYYYGVSHDYPKLYFDRKDRIWNWGSRFIAKFEDGKWDRVEASLGPCRVIEDNKGTLFFIGMKTISCYRNNSFETDVKPTEIPLRLQDASWKCCLWGEDKVLFIAYGNKDAAVLDLKTLQFDRDLLHKTSLSESALYDLFRDRQGNVWVLAGNNNKAENYFYIKVSAKDGTTEEILSTAAIEWDNHRNSQYRESVLCAEDGAIYFGPPGDGVYIFRDGQVSHFGWQQGLLLNSTHWVYEGKDGTIWFGSPQTGIAVYDPKGVAGNGPDKKFANTWQQFAIANRALVKDFEGYLWCCLKDRPKTISRWDGQSWEHFEAGLDTANITGLIVDDLGRLHLRMSDYPSGVYRLWSGKIDHFKDIQDMLEDSVRTGSRQFHSSPTYSLLAPLVTNNREIWFIMPHYNYFSYYDGIQWHQLNLRGDIDNAFKWQDNSVLLKSYQKFFILDKGQLVEFTNDQTKNKQYLLGECGYQPFDEAAYKKNRDRLFPVRETSEGIYIFSNVDDFLKFSENDKPKNAVKLSKYMDRIWLTDGGFWYHSDNLPTLGRYYQGLMLNVDLAATPIGSTLWAYHCDVYDDRYGNMWIRHRDTIYKIKKGVLDTVITTPKQTVYESRKIQIAFTGTSDGKELDNLEYIWQLDDSGWSQPAKNKFVDLNFNESGFHNFEVICVGEIGNIDTTPATLKLNIVILLPEAKIVSAPSCAAECPVIIEYEIVKRQEGSQLSFQWRLDDGEWHNTLDTKVILLSLEEGKHIFEVQAIEDNKYIQAKPARAEFVLKTDYEKIIVREIERLKSGSYSEREKAAATLISIGEKCLPYLKKELEQVSRDTEWWIKNVIWQIEHKDNLE